MAIYKVHIKTDGDTTTYTTNATTLATVIYRTELTKYDVSTPNDVLLVDTAEEADKISRERISDFLATVGVTPLFINDHPSID